MPFFDDKVEMDGRKKIVTTVQQRYEAVDAFYEDVNNLAERMQSEDEEGYSKHRIQIKKDAMKRTVLQYVNGETVITPGSHIDGNDVLKFFRMNPIKKEIDEEALWAYLQGPFIGTVNVLAVNVKPLTLLDYDRLTSFSFYNDVEYAKPERIEFNVPKYVELIAKLPRWTMTKVFEARSNWLCMITDVDKEKLWEDATSRFEEFRKDFEPADDRQEAIIGIWDTLIHSPYVKQYLMYCAQPNALFARNFKAFIESEQNREFLIELFKGPLESIGFLFIPIYFHYRAVEFENTGNKPTFNDLIRITNDPDMYDPRSCAWIAKLT